MMFNDTRKKLEKRQLISPPVFIEEGEQTLDQTIKAYTNIAPDAYT